MFKNKRWRNEQPSKKRWVLFLVIGLGVVLVLGQFIAPSLSSPSVDNQPPPKAQEESTDASTEDDLFLAEYDPNADTFFDAETDEEQPLWQEGGSLALKLALVLGVVYLAMAGLRWLQKDRQNIGGGGTAIRVLETTGLAPGRSLHLVVVGEKTLLIGATDQQFTLLAELAQVTPPLPDEEAVENQSSIFEEALQKQHQKQPQTIAASEWEATLDGLKMGIRRFRESVRV